VIVKNVIINMREKRRLLPLAPLKGLFNE